ncbi:metal-dependent hydrolase [Tuberibacillus sp. Marseille-P3662]|uniref:metal-dependent hydrolase n=1 Tax=Tuberibacillus sp. Marseille-P3662 TaxID=1965358 RepID=UPI000A1C92CD|nr:metal-dependent hydrolase [Tuberibacillus sp. Marseille-P3662]
MKVTYYGQSVVLVETDKANILFDPFISGNGQCSISVGDLPRIDVIILTHGHNDHVGDTADIAKQHGAQIIGIAEIATYFGNKGLNTHGMSIGGGYQFDFGHVKMTPALHGSSYTEDDGTIVYTGMPAGILLTINGTTIYHAGDTALFSDMKLIGERNDIDLAFLPIGDNFTMGPDDAAVAAEWVGAKTVVPVHYNTFPVIEQDPDDFVSKLKGSQGKVLHSGDSIEL